MADMSLFIFLPVMMVAVAFMVMMILMGRIEIGIRMKKKFGMLKGYIISKELKKDGKIYTKTVKIDGNTVKIGDNTYDYDINMTVVNEYDMREGYFSEITGKQFNPFKTPLSQGLTPDQQSDMLILATALGQIPKPFNLPFKANWLIIIGGILLAVFLLFGQPPS